MTLRPDREYEYGNHGHNYEPQGGPQGYDNTRYQQGYGDTYNYEHNMPQQNNGNNLNTPSIGQNNNPSNWDPNVPSGTASSYSNPQNHFPSTQGNIYAASPNYGNSINHSAVRGTVGSSNSFPNAQGSAQPVYRNFFTNNPNAAPTDAIVNYAIGSQSPPGQTVNQFYDTKAYVIPEGFSGYLPDGTYVHNAPCTNCRIGN